jgi:hypothetical protein
VGEDGARRVLLAQFDHADAHLVPAGRPSAGVPAVPIRSVTDQYPPDVRILPAAVGTCSSQRKLHGIERRPPRGDKLAQHARRRPQIARLQG